MARHALRPGLLPISLLVRRVSMEFRGVRAMDLAIAAAYILVVPWSGTRAAAHTASRSKPLAREDWPTVCERRIAGDTWALLRLASS